MTGSTARYDNHRGLTVVDEVRRHRTQNGRAECRIAPGSNDNQIGLRAFGEQRSGRMRVNEVPIEPNGVARFRFERVKKFVELFMRALHFVARDLRDFHVARFRLIPSTDRPDRCAV